MFSESDLNNYQCRYCLFNSEGISEVLYSHYEEIHTVSIAVEKDGSQILYQNKEVIAYVSYRHDKCCINNCVNSKVGKINTNHRNETPSICIRLKYGGDYESIEQYFDNKDYFENEKGIFVCFDLFESTQIYQSQIQWFSKYGMMATFKLKKLTPQKNKNMIILNRTPKPRDRRVIVQKSEIKCTVTSTQEVLLIQQKDLIFNQSSLIEQISIEKSEKIKWRQLANVRKRKNSILEAEILNLKLALTRNGLQCDFKNGILELFRYNDSKKRKTETKAEDSLSDIENENSEIEQSSDTNMSDLNNELAKELQAVKDMIDNEK